MCEWQSPEPLSSASYIYNPTKVVGCFFLRLYILGDTLTLMEKARWARSGALESHKFEICELVICWLWIILWWAKLSEDATIAQWSPTKDYQVVFTSHIKWACWHQIAVTRSFPESDMTDQSWLQSLAALQITLVTLGYNIQLNGWGLKGKLGTNNGLSLG